MSATTANRLRLIDLLGPENVAVMCRPLTDAEAALIDDYLDRGLVEHAAIIAAPDDQLEQVVDRILAEGAQR